MLFNLEIKSYDRAKYEELKNKLTISPALTKLLLQRGINTEEKMEKFLYGSLEHLSNPYELSQMDKAVARIEEAVSKQEKVVIYGDYDVDGICSTVILLECFERLGLKVDYYVPDRFDEGYGLNMEAVTDLAAQDYKLVITVDCGITSIEEVQEAKELGLDFIITDHHNPTSQLPPAVAIVNPKLDDNEENIHLCGAGVAYQLALALCQDITPNQNTIWLDLVALATVADIVPLLGDNRILVKYGLEEISQPSRMGLRALLEVAGLDNKAISTWHIGFVLAPRLNAAGRMDSAAISIELLQAKNYQKALQLAHKLSELNNNRRSVEDKVLKEAVIHIEENINLDEDKILLVAGENWHQGVIGIVASRLVDRYNRPVIIISWEDDLGRGSGRSLGKFNLYEALAFSQEYLIQFGGHKLAAGLSLSKPDFAKFKANLLDYAQEITPETIQYREEKVDVEISMAEIDNQLIEELKLLAPYGEGNFMPRFLGRGLEIINPALVGKNKDHFKCQVLPGPMEAIAFGAANFMEQALDLLKHDVIFTVEENEYLGRKNIQLKVSNIKPTIIPDKPELLNNLKRPQSILQKIIDQVEKDSSVLLIYPTNRTLTKHYMALKSIFNHKLIKRLDGNLYVENRNRVLANWQEGDRGIFLLSQAYFNYLLLHEQLPAHLNYVIDIWPNPSNPLINSDNIIVENLFEPRKIRVNQDQVDIQQEKRAVFYTNRPNTVEKLISKLDNSFILAGQNDYQKRKRLRQKFITSEEAYLLVDGAYDFYGNDITNINTILLADAPFSYYEIMLAMHQISAMAELELVTLFGQKNIDSNKNYLTQNYPDVNTVREVLRYFRSLQTRQLKCDINLLNAKLANFINKGENSFNILPTLWILADLGLCEFRIKGNIIEINFLPVPVNKLNISNSPYYLEGLAEKTAFIEWEQMMIND